MTRYCVRFTVMISGRVVEYACATPFERALIVIAWTYHAATVETWEVEQ